MKKNKTVESEIKKILWKGLSHGTLKGKQWVIPTWEGKNFIFEKKDMVDAIWKIRKRK
jgi:hypothetical protein